jgi:hypothetical protein
MPHMTIDSYMGPSRFWKLLHPGLPVRQRVGCVDLSGAVPLFFWLPCAVQSVRMSVRKFLAEVVGLSSAVDHCEDLKVINSTRACISACCVVAFSGFGRGRPGKAIGDTARSALASCRSAHNVQDTFLALRLAARRVSCVKHAENCGEDSANHDVSYYIKVCVERRVF